ncbi:MAG: metallopeptidase family protein [Corynebacterium sp.]|uniref:metallopeptidase family protein n=1 Tax=Corynebacterium sp. TaxID=1720 RepID=UPI003F9567E6
MNDRSPRPHHALSRDTRGLGLRGILMPRLPRYATRAERFDAAVLDTYAPVLERFADRLDGLDIAVDLVPRMRLDTATAHWSDEVAADGQVPLGRLVPAGVDETGEPTRPRLIVFRRPVEQRSRDRLEIEQWLRFVIAKLVATYLNVAPETVDPGFSWE